MIPTMCAPIDQPEGPSDCPVFVVRSTLTGNSTRSPGWPKTCSGASKLRRNDGASWAMMVDGVVTKNNDSRARRQVGRMKFGYIVSSEGQYIVTCLNSNLPGCRQLEDCPYRFKEYNFYKLYYGGWSKIFEKES